MKKIELKKIIKEELKSFNEASPSARPKTDLTTSLAKSRLDNVNAEFVKIINDINTKLSYLANAQSNAYNLDRKADMKFWMDVRNQIKQLNGDSRKIYSSITDYLYQKNLNRNK